MKDEPPDPDDARPDADDDATPLDDRDDATRLDDDDVDEDARDPDAVGTIGDELASRPGRRNWPMVLGVILIAGGLLGACLAVVSSRRTVAGPVQATNDYLKAYKGGDKAKAYGFLCESLRAKLPRQAYDQEFDRVQTESGKVLRYEVFSTTLEGDVSRTQYRLTTSKGTGTVQAALRREGDDWKLCAFRTIRGSVPTTTSTTVVGATTVPPDPASTATTAPETGGG